MKKWITLFVLVFVIGSITSIVLLSKRLRELNKDYAYAVNNVRAYEEENDSLSDRCRVFTMTVAELESSKDSITKRLNEVREELGIKNKRLDELEYVKSSAERNDTIVFRDTIFRDPSFHIDTLITDKWYSLKLGLYYPSEIAVNPSFISEKYIITSWHKETVKPRKKFFLARWFQKKHTVLETEIVEESPYIENIDSKFIKIIN